MRRKLKLHPDCTAPALEMEAEVQRQPGRVALRYRVAGDLEQILIPPSAARVRGHRLWEHTCFELFVRLGEHSAYHEFNFSPSGEWAAYRLSEYRKGMGDVEIGRPMIDTLRTDVSLEVDVDLDLSNLGELGDEPWHVGLSAVIEDRAGERSFWALNHPPGEPDFHDPACFALELPAPERS